MKDQNTITPHLTEEQVKKLRDRLKGHHLEAIITLDLVTGMRRDELLSLRWQDVNLEKGDLRIQNTKAKKSDRVIHIPEDVTEMLKQHHLHQMETQGKAGLAWANLDLVFPDQTGEPLRHHQLVNASYEAFEQAGLPRLGFHDLRAPAA